MAVSAQELAIQEDAATLESVKEDITKQLSEINRLRKVASDTDDVFKYSHLDTQAASKVRGLEQAQYLALKKANASLAAFVEPKEMASRAAYDSLMENITADNAKAFQTRDEANEMIGRMLQKFVDSDALLKKLTSSSNVRLQRFKELSDTCGQMGVPMESQETQTARAPVEWV